jgi:hypothetical protein
MNKTVHISVCIFGSYARNQLDKFSDKDILIVASSKLAASSAIETWSNEGWSVAFYTWKRLRKMAKNGSLFIQHLKQDGIIEQDPSLELSKLLSSYAPNPCYREEIVYSSDMIRSLDRTPLNKWEIQMQCDVLYTYTRNAGILELASLGCYEFEFSKIVEILANSYSLTACDVKALLRLRTIKAQYRARQICNFNTKIVLETASKPVSKIFNHAFTPINSHSPIRFLNVPYGTLREIEARLISYYSPVLLDNLSTGTLLDDYWDYVTNPRQYSWSIKAINPISLEHLNNQITKFVNVAQSA